MSQRRTSTLLKDWEQKFQDRKDQLAIQSPAPPILGLLKKNSSIGEFPFDESVTPLGVKSKKSGFTQGFCKDHALELGIANLVSLDDDMMSEKSQYYVRDFTVSQLIDEEISDVESHNKKIRSPYEYDQNSIQLSFVDENPEDPVQEMFQMSSHEDVKDKDEPLSLSKNRQKILITEEDQVGPVKSVKTEKLIKNLEKRVELTKSAKANSKDTPSTKLKKRDQKLQSKSSKNRSSLSKLPESGDLQGTKKPSSPQMRKKISESSQELGGFSRKSLRLMKKESNLEECKGCTCKKSQCIKLYCE